MKLKYCWNRETRSLDLMSDPRREAEIREGAAEYQALREENNRRIGASLMRIHNPRALAAAFGAKL